MNEVREFALILEGDMQTGRISAQTRHVRRSAVLLQGGV
jgi:hypothetical protein